MTSEQIDELIALAALGELSTDQQRELDAAAQADPVVAAELDEALAAAAALQRPQAEEPPTALRNSVLAAIAATPQDSAETLAFEPAAVPEGADVGSDVVSLESERSRRRFRPALLAAAAVALFAVGGVFLVATDDASSDEIAAVLDAPDAVSRTLSGQIEALTVTYSAAEDAVVVEGDGVPVLDDEATYQLWLVGDDGATSVGIFRPDADGNLSERFSDTDPTGFVLGVTREPAGGSETPSLPILASA
jgi:anti-sigma-K factor RskA